MAGSAAQTSDSTGTRFRKKNEDVWSQVWVYTFASGDTAEVTQAIPINGILRQIIVKCSGATAVVTATVAIDDNEDNEIWSKATMAESTTYKIDLEELVSGNIDVGVTPSTDPLSAYTVTITLKGI